MKKILLILSCLLSQNAVAEELPTGCYVAYENTSQCWRPSDASIVTVLPPTDQEGYDKFGAIYFTLFNLVKDSLELEKCGLAIASCNSDVNTLIDDYNSMIKVNSELQSRADEQALASTKLVKKLRRACGTKCRKIK